MKKNRKKHKKTLKIVQKVDARKGVCLPLGGAQGPYPYHHSHFSKSAILLGFFDIVKNAVGLPRAFKARFDHYMTQAAITEVKRLRARGFFTQASEKNFKIPLY